MQTFTFQERSKMIFLFLLASAYAFVDLKVVVDKVRLTDVDVITLRDGSMTNARRVAAVPQLTCQGMFCQKRPRVVQCHNSGTDGIDVQWRCEAEMDDAVKFGLLDVSCEGYDYPDDPFVLPNSCGLTYTLLPTKKQAVQSWPPPIYSRHQFDEPEPTSASTMLLIVGGSLLFLCLFVSILIMIAAEVTRSMRHAVQAAQLRRSEAPVQQPAPPIYAQARAPPVIVVVEQSDVIVVGQNRVVYDNGGCGGGGYGRTTYVGGRSCGGGSSGFGGGWGKSSGRSVGFSSTSRR